MAASVLIIPVMPATMKSAATLVLAVTKMVMKAMIGRNPAIDMILVALVTFLILLSSLSTVFHPFLYLNC